jgi:GNAT superfamily N-acetyltransferase
MKYKIRRMKKSEVSIAIDWAKKEGWNPGLYDAEAFYSVDPRGWFVGEIEGEIVSTISAVAYDRNFGFMGFYIVKPDFRGKGYGIRIFDHAFDYLKRNVENIGGDGVLERVDDYAKKGLKLAYKNARYEGYGKGKKFIDKNIVDLKTVKERELIMYDDACFPSKRHKFLKLWLSQPGSFSYGFVFGRKLKGYGVIRKCFEGYKIGPLFADNFAIAEKLFLCLVGCVSRNDCVYLDTPVINKSAVKLARKYGMKKVFETARIYTKGEPDIPLGKWFGVTSFELG